MVVDATVLIVHPEEERALHEQAGEQVISAAARRSAAAC
jgi:hypothetical protein